MKAYYEVKTLNEALEIARKYQDKYGVLLVQNLYESDKHTDCVVIKYERTR